MKREKLSKALFCLPVSLFAGSYLEMFRETKNAFLTNAYSGLLTGDVTYTIAIKILFAAAAIFIPVYLLLTYGKPVLRFAEKHRYPLAACVFAACVLLKLNGSSLSMWAQYLNTGGFSGDPDSYGVLFGFPRPIRSDEWAVFTPMCFSQQNNSFSGISELVRGVPTDTRTVYGLPSLSLIGIFRPFFLGYFLGAEYGLTFYWTGRLIALFLTSYECALLYTNKDKLLSASAAVMLTFSPVVQWWFSTNGFADMLIWGQTAIVIWSQYMKPGRTLTGRILCALALIECAGAFLFTFYPAQEVPLAYLFAALFIGYTLEHLKGAGLRAARDLTIIIGAVIVFAFICLSILMKSRETISLLLSTSYPGGRFETGGSETGISRMFGWIQNLFLPVDAANRIAENSCEAASVISLFPMGTILALTALLLLKRDRQLICLTAVQLFFVLFLYAGFSADTAKLTLMSNVTQHRLKPIMGITEVFLLLRSVKLIFGHAPSTGRLATAIKLFAALVLSAGFTVCAVRTQPDFMNRLQMLMAFAVVFGMIFCLMNIGSRRFAAAFAVIVTMTTGLSGACVNPVQTGACAIGDNELVRAAREIAAEDPDARWITTDTVWVVDNILPAAGAKTLTSTQVYPAFETWEKADPDGIYRDFYNRYTSVSATLTDGPVTFELLNADQFKVSLTKEMLRTLDIGYIVSGRAYSEEETGRFDLTFLTQAGFHFIYHVN